MVLLPFYQRWGACRRERYLSPVGDYVWTVVSITVPKKWANRGHINSVVWLSLSACLPPSLAVLWTATKGVVKPPATVLVCFQWHQYVACDFSQAIAREMEVEQLYYEWTVDRRCVYYFTHVLLFYNKTHNLTAVSPNVQEWLEARTGFNLCDAPGQQSSYRSFSHHALIPRRILCPWIVSRAATRRYPRLVSLSIQNTRILRVRTIRLIIVFDFITFFSFYLRNMDQQYTVVRTMQVQPTLTRLKS